MLRRTTLIAVAAILFVPAAPAAAEDFAPPTVGGSVPESYHGFRRIETVAQGQVGTGYFFAIGDEVNRVVGARVETVGPPTNSRATAAFIQRGVGATYVYGVVGGPGGTSGALPDPPPGEAPAYYPTAPNESSFEGPVTAGLGGKPGEARTVDGRFYATVADDASGVADAAVTRVEVPDAFTVEQASVVSRTGPDDEGLAGESTSVLRGVAIGPLFIESLISRASGFVPSGEGEGKGEAETVVQGATVDKVPVKITSQGIVANDQKNPGAAKQVSDALAQSGLSDVRLLTTQVSTAEGGQELSAVAGGLDIVHRDREFGNSNPQGFEGGGFSIGGAEVALVGTRCQPACAQATADEQTPGTADPGSAPGGGAPVSAGGLRQSLTPPPAEESPPPGLEGPTPVDPSVPPDPTGGGVAPVAPAPEASTPAAVNQKILAAERRLGGESARDVEEIYLGFAASAAVLALALRMLVRPSSRRPLRESSAA